MSSSVLVVFFLGGGGILHCEARFNGEGLARTPEPKALEPDTIALNPTCGRKDLPF